MAHSSSATKCYLRRNGRTKRCPIRRRSSFRWNAQGSARKPDCILHPPFENRALSLLPMLKLLGMFVGSGSMRPEYSLEYAGQLGFAAYRHGKLECTFDTIADRRRFAGIWERVIGKVPVFESLT